MQYLLLLAILAVFNVQAADCTQRATQVATRDQDAQIALDQLINRLYETNQDGSLARQEIYTVEEHDGQEKRIINQAASKEPVPSLFVEPDYLTRIHGMLHHPLFTQSTIYQKELTRLLECVERYQASIHPARISVIRSITKISGKSHKKNLEQSLMQERSRLNAEECKCLDLKAEIRLRQRTFFLNPAILAATHLPTPSN